MAAPNTLIADAVGLQTQPNELTLPAGSLAVATNMEITRDGIAEVSRGYRDFSSNLPDFRPEQLLVVGGVAYLNLDSGLWYYDGTQWLRKQGSVGGGGLFRSIVLAGSRLYVLENNSVSYYETDTGRKVLLCGLPGATGSTTDGVGTAARFSQPCAMCWDGSDTLYIAEQHAIRRLVISTATVSLLAGTVGATGTTDATGSLARFNFTLTVTTQAALAFVSGNLYVVDYANHSIRRVTTGGVVTTFAGLTGTSGDSTGTGTAARFTNPYDITAIGTTLYMSDPSNTKVRAITVPGAVVTTVASGVTIWPITNDGSTLYVGDVSTGAVVSSMTTGGSMTAITGSTASSTVTVDGVGTAAQYVKILSGGLQYAGGSALYVNDINNDGLAYSRIAKVYIPGRYSATIAGGQRSLSLGQKRADGVIVGPT